MTNRLSSSYGYSLAHSTQGKQRLDFWYFGAPPRLNGLRRHMRPIMLPQEVLCGGPAPEEGVCHGVHLSQTWDKLHFFWSFKIHLLETAQLNIVNIKIRDRLFEATLLATHLSQLY